MINKLPRYLSLLCLILWGLPALVTAADLPRLYIDSTPKNAKVIIWNIQPSFSQGMPLLPGDYDIQVQHAGYQPYRETIHIGDANKRLKVDLQPRLYPLRVLLDNVPENQAKIIIWNIKQKFSQGMQLPSGEYKLQVQASGYQTYAETIKINGKALNWKVKMQPTVTTYSAQSVVSDAGEAGFPLYVIPEEASVKILNIKPVFKQGIRLLPGKYHLQIKYKNYETISPWIEIKDGTVYIELLTMGNNIKVANSMATEPEVEANADDKTDDVPPGYYRLNVTTVPENAQVHLFNIQKIYEAGMVLKPGHYLLHISAPNKTLNKKWIQIIDQDVDVHIEL